ncbi:acetyl-CoA carboxylase biotin carboxylase subunit [Parasphaerochaeta coccoides]|uniref:biotin carboxylase n=1 Tax=Parasphaerochaeta coccoides (strain ATCC BAA-1237 / DSM 17374 / SPN1) TaxID=760011 RepID=F4GJL9_PARC1|nr:biotin carboxylase N-terminal domain-containing protein [Parasphaerochaeta coccoides]AEC02766.1 biotin carboxylase; acetyl-CoA carboxylase carboxyltransferase subunit alpha [Parasphaerochaeta coccoides DSM 17374]
MSRDQKKIRTLLIANRGEIAVRIIRTCRDMGIRSVVAYSQADADSLAVAMADHAVCIGPADTQSSYLMQDNIIMAACVFRCDAIHPGVGFLSENAGFARAAEEAGLIFIGPCPRTISLLGDKLQARMTARNAGLKILPGSDAPVAGEAEACKLAEEIGYPVMIKAANGGGGRGIRIVRSSDELKKILPVAAREARGAFGDAALLIEKYLDHPRHVEAQLLGDGQGGAIFLGLRDCSLQKQHQKLLEESPAPALPEAIHDGMRDASLHLFRSLSYRGAGTVEFLYQDGAFYFLEVNARLQVEHTVSEIIYGTDLVRQQILLASGFPFSPEIMPSSSRGHALECRICARGPGKIHMLRLPSGPGVRVDAHIHEGYNVPACYDSLLAKIITYAPDRETCISIMLRALAELEVGGIETNRDEQMMLVSSTEFRAARLDTTLYGKLTAETGKGKNHE